MKLSRIIIAALFIIFSSLTSITYAETLKFGASTYEGEVKKGKAYGVGIITFADGSKYEGKFKYFHFIHYYQQIQYRSK